MAKLETRVERLERGRGISERAVAAARWMDEHFPERAPHDPADFSATVEEVIAEIARQDREKGEARHGAS